MTNDRYQKDRGNPAGPTNDHINTQTSKMSATPDRASKGTRQADLSASHSPLPKRMKSNMEAGELTVPRVKPGLRNSKLADIDRIANSLQLKTIDTVSHHASQPIIKLRKCDIQRHLGPRENPRFKEDMLLMEQDAHALEQKRYLNRLRKSELTQNSRYNEHYSKIFLPEIMRQQSQEQAEQDLIRQRKLEYARYEETSTLMREQIKYMNYEKIREQME